MRALAPPGSAVLVEVPTYLGALAAARGAGLRAVPVPTDSGGLRADLLAEAFARSGARLLYLQPTYANPSGAVLATARRAEVLAAARTAGAFVLEDDWARYLRLDGPVHPPLIQDDEEGRVVHLSSLTKVAAPSLRIGALIARGPARARLAAGRVVDEFVVARPLQETAVELLGGPGWSRHVSRLSTALRARRAVACTCGSSCPRRSTTSTSPPGPATTGSWWAPDGPTSSPSRPSHTCGSATPPWPRTSSTPPWPDSPRSSPETPEERDIGRCDRIPTKATSCGFAPGAGWRVPP
jgi:DNA-binding transcriptional MocR family regulator